MYNDLKFGDLKKAMRVVNSMIVNAIHTCTSTQSVQYSVRIVHLLE